MTASLGMERRTKEWYVSDTSKLSIVRTGNDGRYCVVKGSGLGNATVTCVTTYTIKVASTIWVYVGNQIPQNGAECKRGQYHAVEVHI